MARGLLEEKGFKYREVDAMTSEGIELMIGYNTQAVPTILDEKNKMAFSISDFNRYLEMINEEY